MSDISLELRYIYRKLSLMNEGTLVALGELFAKGNGVSLWTASLVAANDGKFFNRLQSGHTCTLRSAQNVIQRLSDRWPGTVNWPEEVPRPAPRPDGERGQETEFASSASSQPA